MTQRTRTSVFCASTNPATDNSERARVAQSMHVPSPLQLILRAKHVSTKRTNWRRTKSNIQSSPSGTVRQLKIAKRSARTVVSCSPNTVLENDCGTNRTRSSSKRARKRQQTAQIACRKTNANQRAARTQQNQLAPQSRTLCFRKQASRFARDEATIQCRFPAEDD